MNLQTYGDLMEDSARHGLLREWDFYSTPFTFSLILLLLSSFLFPFSLIKMPFISFSFELIYLGFVYFYKQDGKKMVNSLVRTPLYGRSNGVTFMLYIYFLLILPSVIFILEDKFQNRHHTFFRLRNGPEFQPAVSIFTEFDPVG